MRIHTYEKRVTGEQPLARVRAIRTSARETTVEGPEGGGGGGGE